jgi:hypothetical protein
MGESEKIYSSYKAPPYRYTHQSYMAYHPAVPSYAEKITPPPETRMGTRGWFTFTSVTVLNQPPICQGYGN